MNVSDFDYFLPPERIAQEPLSERDTSRLMHIDRESGDIEHAVFHEIIDLLHTGDVLILNNTRVIPARIFGYKSHTGGKIEILLLRDLGNNQWRVLVGGKKVIQDIVITFDDTAITATVIKELDGAERIIEFSESIHEWVYQAGQMPLPPYIHTRLDEQERYQTIYSKYEGSAAAPTAGLHFTGKLLIELKQKGIQLAYCTLHVGLDTFQPVKVDTVQNHHIHSEFATLTAENAKLINEAKLAGGRVIAVGTTSARTLETAAILSEGGDPAHPEIQNACPWRPVIAFEQNTNLFIYPGYKWRVVDAMITNFHLPRSTLLMMISSFVGKELVQRAYSLAIEKEYRFYSFGDAMFIS